MRNIFQAIGRRQAVCLVTAILTLCSGSIASAQKRGLEVSLDPAQTEIHWKLSAGLHTVHGTFKLKSGKLVYDPKTGVAEGEILVDATTGESGNKDRDQRMQNEVLESNRYPAIFFHPTSVKGNYQPGAAPQNLQGEGTFNIHGADHPLEMPLKVQITGDVVNVTTEFNVPYVDWGMKNPSRLLLRVSKQVVIDVNAKGQIKQLD